MTAGLQEYYRQTAEQYDQMHGGPPDEHWRPLEMANPLLEPLRIDSVLDVGCGTGRALAWFDRNLQGDQSLQMNGIDPSPDLLEQAREALPEADLRVGRGEELPFEDESIDVVVATAILHHVEDPGRCIREMARVARKAIFISDHNNFAFGSDRARRLRLGLFAAGLLDVATFIKQGFRRQGYTAGDGWWYPYSLLNNYGLIGGLCEHVYLLPWRKPNSPRLGNFMLCMSHLAVLGIKRSSLPPLI